ncbi:MAG TPA: hypothetical protein VIV55_10020 [Flavobacterium sp.]
MAKFQNSFISGILDKDNDVRLVGSSVMVDAENFVVLTTENSNGGVGRNVPGNIKLTNLNFVSPEVLGSKANDRTQKVYYFVKTATFDTILEFDFVTKATPVTVLQSPTNGALNFKTGQRIINIDIIYSGEIYDSISQQGGDLLAWSGDSNPPRIGNIERMKHWSTAPVYLFTAEDIMLIKAPPLFPPLTVLTNTISENENFLRNKFISFATRFKYKDGYYSAISPWSDYSFLPKLFRLDFASKQNKGMINSANVVSILFTTGTEEVVSIDLLFKHSNNTTVYKVDQYIKKDEGWGNNVVIPTPILFDNSKVYQVLPQSQYFRSYDNVPETASAQTLIGSRLTFANYTEGKNMIDKLGNKVKMTYTVDVSSVSNVEQFPVLTAVNSVSPFDSSVIVKGKIQLNFTGVVLKKDSSIIIGFSLVTLPIVPPIPVVPPDPVRPTDNFSGQFTFLIPNDYADITALINDTANGFKSGLEGYFSIGLGKEILPPTDALPFPPPIGPPDAIPPYSTFNGLQVSSVSANVMAINLPTMQYEVVNVTPPNAFYNEYYTELLSEIVVNSVGSRRSMKSYRSYEIAMIHKDNQGRKTTATVSKKNTIYVPVDASDKKNTIKVDLTTQKPPAWATSYKFAIKENKKKYEEIYITQFFAEGNGAIRWCKLDGENVNKVKVNDVLLVKADPTQIMVNAVTTTVLEIKNQPDDFLPTTGVEPAGLYMKISAEGFSMKIDPNAYREFYASGEVGNGRPTASITIPPIMDGVNEKPIDEGSIFTISLYSHRGGTSDENNSFDKVVIANTKYANFTAFYETQIKPIPFQGTNTGVLDGGLFQQLSAPANTIKVLGTSNAKDTFINPHTSYIDMKITLRTTSGLVIFETLGEETNDGIFYETPDTYPIVNGEYTLNQFDEINRLNVVNGVHFLEKTFNCFMMGNGAESYQIYDAFNEKYLAIDYYATAVSENEYRQVNRFADITYSEPYNTNTNINRLNEFNLSLANYKDDVEKSYGSIIKIQGLDTNLEVFQEDKDSIVYYGKDLLYNADGTTNLTGIPQVLGEQKTYEGEYGISTHPESYARYGFNTYHTDVKRGVVIKKSNNGLFEISSQGMTNYFKELFKNTTILNIIGEYDRRNDFYVLNIKYVENSITKYVTWFYSDKYNGWCLRQTFNPMDMCALNNNFLSFSLGEIYEHNKPLNGAVPNYNTFYGTVFPSSFEFNFSQNPSERKIYSVLEIEGTTPLKIDSLTDQNKGYINSADFELKEGVYYAYIRNSNDTIDSALLSCQGIGNATISSLTLNFSFDLDPIISIGDQIVNANMVLIGTILSKTKKSLTLDTMNSIVSGDYVVCAKTQSIATNSMLGYYMNVKASFNNTSEKEVFAVNTEVIKSNP